MTRMTRTAHQRLFIASFASFAASSSENKSPDDRSLPRRRNSWRRACIDESEARNDLAIDVAAGIWSQCDGPAARVGSSPSRPGVGGGQIGRLIRVENEYSRPVEYVAELGPDVESGSFADPERPAHREIFLRNARIPVIAVVWRSGPKLAWSRIGPRVRIQHKFLVRIEAVAVHILQE